MNVISGARRAYRAIVPLDLRQSLWVRRRLHKIAAHGAIFIHVPKTGGASIVSALYGADLLHHKTAHFLNATAPAAFAGLPSFSVVRDPWDRCASAYRFIKNGGGIGHGSRTVRDRSRYEIPAFSTFERFVEEWLPTADLMNEDRTLHYQHHYVCDQSGNILVKWLGRTERMDEVTMHLRELLGHDIKIPVTNTSGPRMNYRTLYDSRTADIVASIYSRDIELFGYSF